MKPQSTPLTKLKFIEAMYVKAVLPKRGWMEAHSIQSWSRLESAAYALPMLGGDPLLAALLNSGQPMLEAFMFAGRSASGLNPAIRGKIHFPIVILL